VRLGMPMVWVGTAIAGFFFFVPSHIHSRSAKWRPFYLLLFTFRLSYPLLFSTQPETIAFGVLRINLAEPPHHLHLLPPIDTTYA